jgi:hypothetical protein
MVCVQVPQLFPPIYPAFIACGFCLACCKLSLFSRSSVKPFSLAVLFRTRQKCNETQKACAAHKQQRCPLFFSAAAAAVIARKLKSERSKKPPKVVVAVLRIKHVVALTKISKLSASLLLRRRRAPNEPD